MLCHCYTVKSVITHWLQLLGGSTGRFFRLLLLFKGWFHISFIFYVEKLKIPQWPEYNKTDYEIIFC